MSVEPFIKCSDIHASIKFYTEVLDFKLKLAPNPDPASFDSKHAMIERDGYYVHLSAHAGDGVFGNDIYVRVGNIDDIYASAVNSGLNIKDVGSNAALRGGPIEQSWGMKEFWVNDPDGNKVTYGHPLE